MVFTGMAATKDRPRGNATARHAIINLFDEEEEETLVHVAPVVNREKSAMLKALGGTDGTERHNNQPVRDRKHGTHNNTRIHPG